MNQGFRIVSVDRSDEVPLSDRDEASTQIVIEPYEGSEGTYPNVMKFPQHSGDGNKHVSISLVKPFISLRGRCSQVRGPRYRLSNNPVEEMF